MRTLEARVWKIDHIKGNRKEWVMQNHILDYLDEIVRKVPEKTAFSNGTESMSFQAVYDQSRSVGSFLQGKGLYGEPVVVFMEKHPKTITAFFGVVKGGNFYVPLDDEMPLGRMELILENLKPRMMICDEKTSQVVPALAYEGEVALYDDICTTPIAEEALLEIYQRAIDTDPIYVVFTSGSTGVPKGVVACHRSVIDYIEQLSEVLGFQESTVFGNQTPLYFDACLKELYPTLKFGATTYLIPQKLFMLPVQLVEYLNAYRINTICWVVSALTMISAFQTFRTIVPEYLHTIAFGSEVFPIKQFKRWREALPEACFTNLYGPTEGTGMCCYYKVEREFAEHEAIPIGRPFKNTQILLLTEQNKCADLGEEGEICIRGTSLTLGYYNNPEKTKEVFVQNPLQQAYPETIYRTGDIGRLNERGELLFVTRKDNQIKHMGHRIELGEIEVNVNRVDGIHSAGCIYDNKKGKIVLFYTGSLDTGELSGALKGKLPRYMMPNQIRQLERLPLTANGKIDRITLKKHYEESK